MSDSPDGLEEALRSLRPRGISPTARRRIAWRLGRRWRVATVTAAGLAAAACLIVVVIIWRSSGRTETGEPDGHDVRLVSTMPAPSPTESLPTLLVYRRAAERSEAAFDALLTQHAEQLLAATPDDDASLAHFYENRFERHEGEGDDGNGT